MEMRSKGREGGKLFINMMMMNGERKGKKEGGEQINRWIKIDV